MRKCSLCGAYKEESGFYRDKTKVSGFRSRCIDCIKKTVAEEKASNPEKFKEYSTSWYHNNKAKIDARTNERRKENPEAWRAATRRYQKKIHSTPRGKIDRTMSVGIRASLKGNKNNRQWEGLVGYGVEDLMQHLQRKFKPGMNWDNYGQWHIDHKIPKAAHNYEKAEDVDFMRCWSLKNLQPLWATENSSKRDKVDKPFQPSLSMSM